MSEIVSIGNSVIDRYLKSESFFEEEETLLQDVSKEVYSEVEQILPGGRGANQAVAASLAGGDVKYMGKVGSESSHLTGLEDKDVEVDVAPYIGETAEALIFSDESIGFKSPEQEVDAAYIDRKYEDILDAEYLLLHNGINTEAVEHLLSGLEEESESPSVVFDPAPIRNYGKVLDYDSIDYVTPNTEEYRAAERLFDGMDAEVIETMAEGAEVEGYFAESLEVPVIDTTGAGDTFNGYLVAKLSKGESLENAMETATNAASLSVTRIGGQKAPTWKEVKRTL